MIISQLEKINKFTRRELTADEVYIFSVILCDNEIDRDCERFSDTALEELKKLFVGKTGIFDHDAKSSKQSARIFDTELVTDSSRTTKNGEVYKYLKGHVYMVRTDDNRSLISEIDGGIKKEVSISCTASERHCSVCGCDRTKNNCTHMRGKVYNGKLCHTVLSGITDAYEWSFVAVPAQVNAGVTKRFSDGNEVHTDGLQQGAADSAENELLCEIRRLAFVSGGRAEADFALQKAAAMNAGQLAEMKKEYERKNNRFGIQLQSCTGCAEASDSDFCMK
ncbi:MAG: hypothetical protein E7497_05075 [Ruminococcus sp.]|nr:hypothetical protein [Ruminococcus sp.]